MAVVIRSGAGGSIHARSVPQQGAALTSAAAAAGAPVSAASRVAAPERQRPSGSHRRHHVRAGPERRVRTSPALAQFLLQSTVRPAAALHLADAADACRCAGAGLLCFGVSSAIDARKGTSAAKSTTSCRLLLCWAAAALFATAAHLGFALGLRAAGFDSRSTFLQGTSC